LTTTALGTSSTTDARETAHASPIESNSGGPGLSLQ
jgi:hypothetical protein